MAQLLNGNEVITPTKADETLAKKRVKGFQLTAGQADRIRVKLKVGKTK